eukprot:4575782-Prymnesium_polylepis.1
MSQQKSPRSDELVLCAIRVMQRVACGVLRRLVPCRYVRAASVRVRCSVLPRVGTTHARARRREVGSIDSDTIN